MASPRHRGRFLLPTLNGLIHAAQAFFDTRPGSLRTYLLHVIRKGRAFGQPPFRPADGISDGLLAAGRRLRGYKSGLC